MKLYLKNTFCLVLALSLLPLSAHAAEYGNQRRRNGRDSEKDERMNQRRQEAEKDFAQIDDALKEILQKVEQNQRPDATQVQAAAALLEANKRNAQVFDEKQKAQYMLLHSWTGYAQGDAPTAFNWSIKACKTDPDNQDAWISQGLFSMLNGRPPQQPRPPKPEKRRPTYNYGNRRNEETPRPEPKVDLASLYGHKGILDFDMTTLRPDVLREQIGRFEYLAADGQTIEFKPGRDVLCALFWQSEEEIDDPNDLTTAAAKQLRKEDDKEVVVPPELTIEKQRQYFKMLFDACKQDENVKFLQINTTKPLDYDAFMKSLPAYNNVPYPTVVAAAPSSNAQSIVGTDAKIPFMMIADKKGDVKYAGPAKDFMPAFILTETTGLPIDLQGQSRSNNRHGQGHDPMLDELMTLRSAMQGNPQNDPNKPTADPNSITQQVTPKPNVPTKTYRQLSDVEEYQAGKDFEYAKTFMGTAKAGGTTYKNAVEQCRKVIRKYPDTEYEQQARVLLREVPERKRDLYKITDDELGLH